MPKGEVVTEPDDTLADGEENLIDLGEEQKDRRHAMQRNLTVDSHVARLNGAHPEPAASPKAQSFLRRTSSTAYTSDRESVQKKPMKPEMREHLKHLGPSNLASRPRQTRYNTVKIKPGSGSLAEGMSSSNDVPETPQNHSAAAQGGVGAGIVNSAGKDAKDGVLAVQAGYGTIPSASPPSPKKSRKGSLITHAENSAWSDRQRSTEELRPTTTRRSRAASDDTLRSMQSGIKSPSRKRGTARSGSITENIIDMGGIKKTVLETTSSSDDPEDGGAVVQGAEPSDGNVDDGKENNKPAEGGGKKKRRRKRKGGGTSGEEAPLLGQGS